ncbi:serine/threonine protein kinase [Laceyella putida]|uniref:Serine/threonine protein kinase n=1 Tax=Laceyella putida TaxID=110101 RepID=A0ABW2RJY1_9BACL
MDDIKLDERLQEIRIHANERNEPVEVEHIPPIFRLIGVGTDAVVVQHPDYPELVFKCYALDRLGKKEQEQQVYERLGDSPYFAKLKGSGARHLALSYEPGPTLYQCLEQGIIIPEQVIEQVEEARRYARSKGLNPRDIHLKNVILQGNKAKVIDVSEYLNPGNDQRWDHLVEGYHLFYSLIRGKKLPAWLIEAVKNIYLQQQGSSFHLQEFGKKIMNLFGLGQSNQDRNEGG